MSESEEKKKRLELQITSTLPKILHTYTTQQELEVLSSALDNTATWAKEGSSIFYALIYKQNVLQLLSPLLEAVIRDKTISNEIRRRLMDQMVRVYAKTCNLNADTTPIVKFFVEENAKAVVSGECLLTLLHASDEFTNHTNGTFRVTQVCWVWLTLLRVSSLAGKNYMRNGYFNSVLNSGFRVIDFLKSIDAASMNDPGNYDLCIRIMHQLIGVFIQIMKYPRFLEINREFSLEFMVNSLLSVFPKIYCKDKHGNAIILESIIDLLMLKVQGDGLLNGDNIYGAMTVCKMGLSSNQITETIQGKIVRLISIACARCCDKTIKKIQARNGFVMIVRCPATKIILSADILTFLKPLLQSDDSALRIATREVIDKITGGLTKHLSFHKSSFLKPEATNLFIEDEVLSEPW